ncbi:hypothetical protein [Bacillus paralicheniformis]|nr:hypothetical protein [Bacillus paralicheniformis]
MSDKNITVSGGIVLSPGGAEFCCRIYWLVD